MFFTLYIFLLNFSKAFSADFREFSQAIFTALEQTSVFWHCVGQFVQAFLWKKKYKDEQQMREYVKKICEKIKHMKQVNDHMSEYSLIQEEKEIAEQPLDGTGRK